MRKSLASSSDGPLYDSVAAHVTRLIEGGTFRVGERVPSVRHLARQLNVSITTVLAAYRMLEDRAYIEARPQSGYFVKSAGARMGKMGMELATPKVPRMPSKITVHDLVPMVMHDALNPDLVQLGAAIPNPKLLPIARLQRTIGRLARLTPLRANAYAIPPGIKELRVQIARRALTHGCTLTPDEILITTGAQEAITLCLQTLCKAGDTVALESPCYYGFLQAMETLGLKGLEIPCHPREGLSLEALEAALKDHDIKAVMAIPNFNNPLGSLMPTVRKKMLVQMLAERNVPLIEDDIYGDLAHIGPTEARPATCKSFDKKGLVLLCDSFSKTLSPGLRVGYAVPGKFMEAMMYRKLVQSIASATLPQFAVADFLATGGYDRHLRGLRRTLAKNTRQLGAAVLRHFPEGTKVTHPHGGHILWVQMPEEVDSMQLYPKAIEKGITIAPGPLFSTQSQYRNYIRLNAAFWEDEGPVRALAHLAAGMMQGWVTTTGMATNEHE